MPGKTKRKYVGELLRFNKSLKQPLRNIKSILPQEYSSGAIITEFKMYYPLIWKEMQERFEHYKAKDDFLIRNGKKIRYKPLPPHDYLLSLPQIKLWLSKGGLENHKVSFDRTSQQENIKFLTQERDKSKNKYETKIKTNTRKIQEIEPLYIDAFIAAYHQRGISTEGKIEILNELKKFQSEKIIHFFYKINDAEKNNQIREMAFNHLQSVGKYVKLRPKFRGKQKTYMVETSDFDMTPEDLWQRLESNKIQNKKHFDFFISHSYANKNEVLNTIKCLNKQGYAVYCDWASDNDFLKRDLVSDHTKLVLKKRLEQSENIMLLKSEKALNSDWVAFELEYFTKIGRPIYFIELDATTDPRLEKFKRLDYDFSEAFIQNPKELTE